MTGCQLSLSVQAAGGTLVTVYATGSEIARELGITADVLAAYPTH